jgi:hypothetical protein
MSNNSTVQSAFALARSGDCSSIDDIRRRLKSDGHDQVDAHLSGPSLSRQLRQLCAEAMLPREAPGT